MPRTLTYEARGRWIGSCARWGVVADKDDLRFVVGDKLGLV
jgi:hypothetical protein